MVALEELKKKHVLIVGAGVAGLSTSRFLALAGVRVTVLDYQPYQENGYTPSKGCDAPSADVNKVMRASYGSQIEYQRLAFQARDLFVQWEKDIANIPPEELPPSLTPNSPCKVLCLLIRGGHEAPQGRRCQIHTRVENLLKLNYLEKKGYEAKLNSIKWDGDGVLDMTGGYTIANNCCTYGQYLARKAGVEFILGEAGKVSEIVKDTTGGTLRATGVKTADGKFRFADLVIVACGGWTPSLLPEVSDRLETTAGSVINIQLPPKGERPDLWDKYSPQKSSVWSVGLYDISGPRGNVYGFPRTEDGVIKIGYRGLKWTNFVQHPLDPARRISVPKTRYTDLNETRVPVIAFEAIKTTVKQVFPDLAEAGRIIGTRLCWYCDSLDNNFLIDYVPDYDESLFVVSGGSGHMFKFLPNLGEKVIDALLGKGTEYTKLWKWPKPELDRLEWIEKSNGLEEGEVGPRVLRKLVMVEEADMVF
ncbi:nucleotide-binding domain-containing protein [Fistulina hepatica ATCC 64428]|uniref:Nucleotide-binding domain-containing protein n=1 Tax=Fistulina hepatica ATCC 64428 TaxID=1128425 RepID=A0A0D7A1D6_9AGAR|nr:nucleotide-binding domain-containing protein [Fistulina hepatica ATCC 64428]